MQSLPKKSLLPFTEEHEAFRKEFGEFLDREIVPYYMDMEKKTTPSARRHSKSSATQATAACGWTRSTAAESSICSTPSSTAKSSASADLTAF